ncbi:conserved hypothetical protein [Campylobacter coli RM2228]|nr:conserved hypothetical protein [Campylobacter coli RM2228]
MYSYLLNDKIKNHSMILCTEIECKKCGEKIMLSFSRMKNLFSNVLIAREKIERFFMRSSLEKVIKNYNENFSNKRDNDFAQGLIKYLYENAIIGENDKFFLEKNFQYIRIINEKEKRLINVYFCEKPIIDFFQNAEYEKELQYYGINEKDFIKTDI